MEGGRARGSVRRGILRSSGRRRRTLNEKAGQLELGDEDEHIL